MPRLILHALQVNIQAGPSPVAGRRRPPSSSIPAQRAARTQTGRDAVSRRHTRHAASEPEMLPPSAFSLISVDWVMMSSTRMASSRLCRYLVRDPEHSVEAQHHLFLRAQDADQLRSPICACFGPGAGEARTASRQIGETEHAGDRCHHMRVLLEGVAFSAAPTAWRRVSRSRWNIVKASSVFA